MSRRSYLGDGVYAAYDEGRGCVVLTTEGSSVTNTIYLDESVLSALDLYVTGLRVSLGESNQ